MTNDRDIVIFIVDDDEAVQRALSLLLKSAGHHAITFRSAEEFLENTHHHGIGCILLDVFLDGRTGLELHDEIKARFPNLPVIYISGLGDIPMSVQALRKGSLDFIQKPIDQDQLFRAVDEALEVSRVRMKEDEDRSRSQSLIDSLTPREYQVFLHVIRGKLNKQIAGQLNIAEHTVKLHRGKITEKLGVKSVAQMVALAQKLNLL